MNYTKNELIEMLGFRGHEQEQLFENARKVREARFGRKVYVRAVIEPSSYCRQDCCYCPMRRSNIELERYRLGTDEIIESAERARALGVETILLKSGEDSQIIDAVTKATSTLSQRGYKVILCIGDLKADDYQRLRDAGADSYILKFETSDEALFEKLRPGTTLKNRLKNLKLLRKLGYQISTGNIVGLPGQSVESLTDDIMLAQDINPDMVSASPFIPAAETPLENSSHGDFNSTLNVLAIYRITLSHTFIPAVSALEYYDGGQLAGFNAGCNVATINMTPESRSFPIYATTRLRIKLDRVRETVNNADLELELWKS